MLLGLTVKRRLLRRCCCFVNVMIRLFCWRSPRDKENRRWRREEDFQKGTNGREVPWTAGDAKWSGGVPRVNWGRREKSRGTAEKARDARGTNGNWIEVDDHRRHPWTRGGKGRFGSANEDENDGWRRRCWKGPKIPFPLPDPHLPRRLAGVSKGKMILGASCFVLQVEVGDFLGFHRWF